MKFDYNIPVSVTGEQINVIDGIFKFMEYHSDEIVIEINRVINKEFLPILPEYLATMFCIAFLNENGERPKYISVKTQNKDEDKSSTRPTKQLLHKNNINMKMKLNEIIKEYTGREFEEQDKWGYDGYKYRNVKLDENNCFYRISDELQIILNINIREIIKNALKKRNYFYIYEDQKKYTSFRSTREDTLDAFVDIAEEWFIENTKIKDIPHIAEIVAGSSYGNMSGKDVLISCTIPMKKISEQYDFKMDCYTNIYDAWQLYAHKYAKIVQKR